MDSSWFLFSIFSTTLFGISMALFKLPAAKNVSRYATTFWFLLFAALLSVIAFPSYITQLSGKALLITAIWGITFTLLSLLQMYALRRVDTSVLFPITTTVSLVITVVYGLVFFNDTLSFQQAIGIVLIIAIVYSFLFKGLNLHYSKYLLIIGLSIISLSAFNKILLKVGVTDIAIETILIYQHFFAMVVALIVLLWKHKADWKKQIRSSSLKYGGLIGLFSFGGGYAFLSALDRGPFSLVSSVHSLYILVTAIIGFVLYKEGLDRKRIFLILAAVVALILIRIG